MQLLSPDSTLLPRIEKFTTLEFHSYLLGGDVPPEQLPKTIDLSPYTEKINEIYETQNIVGAREDVSLPLEQRQVAPKLDPVAAERGCTIYCDPETRTIKFTPISHGTEESVRREAFDLIHQNKLPILEIHTHPDNALFSPEDYALLLWSIDKEKRLMKAALLLCPTNQVLAVASTKTAKFTQDEVAKLFEDQKIKHGDELNQVVELIMEKTEANSQRFQRAFERLKKLAETKKFTLDKIMKTGNAIHKQHKNYLFRHDSEDKEKLFQKQNELLFRFAVDNDIKLYFSTDRSIFKEFSA